MYSLSINVICRNSAATIGRALSSTLPLLNHPDLPCELVVIDTGSTDDTLTIAGEFATEVGCYPWDDSFSRARNVALAASEGDWIMFLDADEEIPAETIPAIVEICSHEPKSMYISIVEQECKGAEGHTHWSNTRLFPKKDARWKFRVHEQVVYPEGPDHPRALVHPGLIIKHFGDVVNDPKKAEYYLELARKDYEQFPKSWHCMKQYAFGLVNVGGRTAQALGLLYQVKQDMPPDAAGCGVARTVYQAILDCLKQAQLDLLTEVHEKKEAGWWWGLEYANMMFVLNRPEATKEICEAIEDSPWDGFGTEHEARERIGALKGWAISALEDGNGNPDGLSEQPTTRLVC